MYKQLAAQIMVATTVALILGAGCGSTGSGCSFQPLPKDSAGNFAPAPLGLPTSQVIEGGLQARITKPGMDKLMATIPSLFGPLLNGICIPKLGGTIGGPCPIPDLTAGACFSNNCANNAMGCPASVQLTSSDGRNGITATLSDGNNPVIHVDVKLDFGLPLEIDYGAGICGANANGMCTLGVQSSHYNGANGNPIEIAGDIQTGIDPTTGELTLHLAGLTLINLGLQIGDSGSNPCLSGIGKDLFNSLLGLLNTQIANFFENLVLKVLQPTLDNLVQSFLPKPLGLAGVINTGALLSSFNPPKDANLEMFIVPGGYVQGKSGGLTLGVMSGANSDRDETTRTPMLASEPNLCVPARAVPDVGGAPWHLPFNAARKDFTLLPAGPFSGNPEPTDSMGMLQDVAIGLSRTYLNLIGFHAISSGTLCLEINGSAISQLNAGTFSLLVQSLGNIVEDKKAPLELVLRPQTPILFTIGAGTMMDPLLHIGISDLRIDFYAWIEERFVRILTLAIDLNVGLNLTVTKDANGKAAIEPMLVGLNANNVTIRVTNSDLLQESTDTLAKTFPSLINVVTSALGGVLGKPITLPAVAGFSLTDFSISRVQTSQDDFVGIFANLTQGGPAPIIDWTNPGQPVTLGAVHTQAAIAQLTVPPPAALRALFSRESPLVATEGERPSVTLDLAAEGAAGRPLEWAYRVDGGMWHVWSREPHPTITDDAFLLQGHHKLEVRSRVVNEWTTQDMTPAALDVLVDSVAPELHPARDPEGKKAIALNGFDIVTPTEKLQYAWLDASGKQSAWSSTSTLDLATLRAISDNFRKQVVVFAKDEAGLVGQTAFDAGVMLNIQPGPAATGCSMSGAADDSSSRGLALLALALLALVFHRRRQALAKAAAFVVIGALACFVAGCGCQNHNQCAVDDDCAKMQCPAGQIPSCASNACMCVPDLYIGDIGRFSSMTVIDASSYVSAYNNTYGDLMIGHIVPPGIVSNWDFVDGVPDTAPDYPNSHVRGGIQEKGDDVGRYTSIGATKSGDPVIAYYDKTHGSLKFASFGVIRWHTHVVDKGTLTPDGMGDDIGRWASMTVDSDGKPAIAYSAWVQKGMSGNPESQLRWAQANVPNPQSASDWTVSILDARPLAQYLPMDMGTSSTDMAMALGPDMASSDMASAGDGGASMPPPMMPDEILPPGLALMSAAARNAMGLPAIVYYDYERGNLRYIEFNPNMGKWTTPAILDGEDAMGNDTGDVGRYPSLIFDMNNVGHIAYESGPQNHLYYINTKDRMRVTIDDGYHTNDENTQDGIPSPVFHFVGDSSSLAITPKGQPVVAYQDSTLLQLRLAVRQDDGTWSKQYIAGHAMPFKGSYGFYASLQMTGGNGVLSTYAINQQLPQPSFWVEVFALDFGAGAIE
jgi:MYXO-CTERM domain-containing protein